MAQPDGDYLDRRPADIDAFLTLLVVPVVYTLFDEAGTKVVSVLRRASLRISPREA